MDKNLKVKWISRLRGGQYAQGRGRLRRRLDNENGYAYCCLGVLCDAIDPTAWDDHDGWKIDGHDGWKEMSYGGTVITGLSSAVLAAIGMHGEQQNMLIVLNDKERKSFAEIADWIEENL